MTIKTQYAIAYQHARLYRRALLTGASPDKSRFAFECAMWGENISKSVYINALRSLPDLDDLHDFMIRPKYRKSTPVYWRDVTIGMTRLVAVPRPDNPIHKLGVIGVVVKSEIKRLYVNRADKWGFKVNQLTLWIPASEYEQAGHNKAGHSMIVNCNERMVFVSHSQQYTGAYLNWIHPRFAVVHDDPYEVEDTYEHREALRY